MPEEIEAPTEHLHEKIHEEAEHGGGWTMAVALSTALLAVFAAISSLLAGHHANEAMLEQIKASDTWAYYQAKGIKAAVLESKMDLLKGMEREPAARDEEKSAEYKQQQKEIEEKAREAENASTQHMQTHTILARSVTVFQVSIAVAAISVLTRKKWLWLASMALGIGGLAFFIQGIL